MLAAHSIRNMYLNFCRRRTLQNKQSGGNHPAGLLYKRNRLSGSVGQHSLISAAAVLINNSLAGLVIDFVALAAGLGNIRRRCFVTVAQENHRLIVRVGSFIVFVGGYADDLTRRKLMRFFEPLHYAAAAEDVISSIRWMIVHSLHISWREIEDPRF